MIIQKRIIEEKNKLYQKFKSVLDENFNNLDQASKGKISDEYF